MCMCMRVYVSVSVNLLQNYAHLFQFLLLEFCVFVVPSRFLIIIQPPLLLLVDAFIGDSRIKVQHTHSTHTYIKHSALDCFISLFCSQHLFAKLISVPFLSLTFFQVRVTIIMSSACMHVPCASAYKLCVRWYAEQSYRLFYGAFYTQSQGVMCVCRKSFAITPAGFFITSVSFSFPRHFRNYVCFIVCANYMHSWSTHSILFGRYTNSKCFHLICPACDIHFDFSYFTAIQHINRTEERFQDRILT